MILPYSIDSGLFQSIETGTPAQSVRIIFPTAMADWDAGAHAVEQVVVQVRIVPDPHICGLAMNGRPSY